MCAASTSTRHFQAIHDATASTRFARGPDEATLQSQVQEHLNKGFKPGLLELVALKRPLAKDATPPQRSLDVAPLPSRLYIECTAACNISCAQACCAPETGITRTRQAGMLDFDLFRRVLDEAGPSLGRVDERHGTPVVAIALMALLTAAAAMFGDAILVPITEVGSLAVGVGWLSACAAYIARRRTAVGGGYRNESSGMAWVGCAVSVAIILMKVVPGVPGSFTRPEWVAFVAWSAFGLVFWLARPRVKPSSVTHAGG